MGWHVSYSVQRLNISAAFAFCPSMRWRNSFTKDLRSQKLRAVKLDLRIAAIALSQGATIFTRNKHDFEQLPGLKIEDRGQ
jgi:hypothetical protein